MSPPDSFLVAARSEPPAGRAGRVDVSAHHHVHFYEGDQDLAAEVGRYLEEGLRQGEALLVIATPDHQTAFCAHLLDAGFDPEALVALGDLTLLDAAQAAEEILVDGRPCAQRFAEQIGTLVEARLGAGQRRLRIYGEIVDLLWRQGHQHAAIMLEELWNDLALRHPFSLLCGYAFGGLACGPDGDGLHDVRAQHAHATHFLPPSPETDLDEDALRQKVRLLEAEVAHRTGLEAALREALAQRRRAEEELAHDVAARVALEAQLLAQNDALRTLNRIAAVLGEARLDLEHIVQLITDEATALVGAAFGAFFYTTTDEQGDSFLLYTLSGAPKEAFAGFGMPRNSQIFRPTFVGECVVRCDDVHEDPRYGHNAPHFGMPTGHLPVTSYLAVPVVSTAGVVIGGLFFGHPERGRFTTRHEELVVGIAAQAAAALDNAQLYRAAQEAEAAQARRAQHAALLHEAAAALSRALTPTEVVDTVAHIAADLLHASAAVIYLVDDDGALHLAAEHGLPHVSERYPQLTLDTPLPLADAIKGRAPLYFDDREALLAAYPHLVRAGVSAEQLQAVASLPMAVKGGLLGGVALSYSSTQRFDAPEREMLETLTQHIAEVLERARLFEAELRVREEREALIAELSETVRLNELFAGVLAHDLRNPLGAILTAAQVALLKGDDEAVNRPLRRVVSSGQRMARMIEQLLDFTRIRVGRGLMLSPLRADLAGIIAPIVHELEDANPDCQIRTQAVGDTSGRWDTDRLQQVFSNLAANAVQHGEKEGGVDIVVDGRDPERVVTRVTNRGAVKPELLPTLFDPFRGAAQARTGMRGLGLGLFISQQLVVAHGGTLDVTTSEEAGTTFVVRLPR